MSSAGGEGRSGSGRKRQEREEKRDIVKRDERWRTEHNNMRETEKIRSVVEMKKNGGATRREERREKYGKEAEEQQGERQERKEGEERMEVEVKEEEM